MEFIELAVEPLRIDGLYLPLEPGLLLGDGNPDASGFQPAGLGKGYSFREGVGERASRLSTECRGAGVEVMI